jgi:putative hydrolase of the HAD superfamily
MTYPWPKAIFLDLDDTIIAYSKGVEACWERLCEDYSARVAGTTPGALLAALDEVRGWYWRDPERHRRGRLDLRRARRQIVVQAFSRLEIDAPDLAEEMADSYTIEREESMELFPEVVEALRAVRRRTKHLALITNGNEEVQRRKILKFDLAPFFDYILVEGEFGMGKPEARVYRHVLEQLDVRAEETWMVGDNLEWDVAAPQRLGMKGIWLDHAGAGLPAGTEVSPDHIIRHLSELLFPE